jgi:hypothetical protein
LSLAGRTHTPPQSSELAGQVSTGVEVLRGEEQARSATAVAARARAMRRGIS